MVHKVHEVLAWNRAGGVIFGKDHDLVPVAVVLPTHQRAAHGQLVTQHLQKQCTQCDSDLVCCECGVNQA